MDTSKDCHNCLNKNVMYSADPCNSCDLFTNNQWQPVTPPATQKMTAAEYIKTIDATVPENPLDVQVGGNHYKDKGIQPVEYIRANGLCFFRGNVLKYITRDKNGIEDLKKARHYLDMLIQFEENK